jgi:8-oxo-dGTP pyrophosphatase MutT (NUDIX family)
MTEAEAAVAILHSSGTDSVLLMRRAERAGDSWSGHWSFPGGRRDSGDADALHTALRELEEECGIRLDRDAMETELPARHARRKAGAFVWVTPFVFRCPNELSTILDAREAAGVAWVPLATLRDRQRHWLMAVPGLPPEMLYPAVPLEGAPLWGFTYHLVLDWLGMAPADPRAAGLEAARGVLSAVLDGGAALSGDWTPRGSRLVAEVSGRIQTAALRERYARPGDQALGINCLHLGEDRVRLVGPAYEEYLIVSRGAALPHL